MNRTPVAIGGVTLATAMRREVARVGNPAIQHRVHLPDDVSIFALPCKVVQLSGGRTGAVAVEAGGDSLFRLVW